MLLHLKISNFFAVYICLFCIAYSLIVIGMPAVRTSATVGVSSPWFFFSASLSEKFALNLIFFYSFLVRQLIHAAKLSQKLRYGVETSCPSPPSPQYRCLPSPAIPSRSPS